MSDSLADIGEHRAIGMIRKQYGYSWSDDDAAEIDSGKDYTLITTDAISQKSHIPQGASYDSVGYFFAALNLSDIAAMGGQPKYFMAAMTFPKRMRAKNLKMLERGIKRCLDRYGVKLIGGDLKQGAELNMAGVAVGTVSKKGILRRNGARPGDLVCITGKLGKNGAAYQMWKKSKIGKWADLLLEIEPRIKEGTLLSKYDASSAMDLSDGLYSAVTKLSGISKKGFEIRYEKVPIDRFANVVSKNLGVSIEDIAFDFGGEYELLFTISRSNLNKLQRAARQNRVKISAIGRVYGKKPVMLKNGKKIVIKDSGYEHFSR